MKKINKKRDWWNNNEDGLHYAEYKVNQSIIQVGGRPNCYGTTKEVYDSINGFINVSDRYVRHDKNKANIFIPWNEGGQPTVEAKWACLKTLHYWINEDKLEKIYIHCDGGTHRAVTMFGFYLIAYHKDQADDIQKKYTLKGRNTWSSPLEYAHSYIRENKVILLQKFLDNIKKSEDSYSHGQELGDFLTDIYTEDDLKEYYSQRFYHSYTKSVYYHIKYALKHYGIYILFQKPYNKLRIKLHKLFNTKQGQFYKKNGF